MLPSERDAAYLWDMLEASRTVREFLRDIRFDQYIQDRKLQMAVERGIEIVGEAARHVSDEYRQAHSEIPWRRIIAQRHVLAHEYGEIKQELLWKMAIIRIPELIALLEPLIPPVSPESAG
jgi:uncharacterized protein with HEPN domain